jgi:CheY-like chemotaxis protein
LGGFPAGESRRRAPCRLSAAGLSSPLPEPDVRLSLRIRLSRRHGEVRRSHPGETVPRAVWWQSGEEALCHLPDAGCQVLVCDIRLPDLDGEQLFRRVLPALGATPVIFITVFGAD